MSSGEKECDQPDTGYGHIEDNPLADGCKVLFLNTKTAQHNAITKSRTKMPKYFAVLSVDII